MNKDLFGTFIKLCCTYDVRVVQGAVPASLKGPRRCGCSPVTRELYVPENLLRDGTLDDNNAGDSVELEEVLHELMHIVFAHPNAHIEEVPEDWFLMQVERAVATCMFPAQLAQVIDWQDETVGCFVAAPYEPMVSVEAYECSRDWVRGIRLAQKLGVLTEGPALRAEPIYVYPDWSRLTPAELTSWSDY